MYYNDEIKLVVPILQKGGVILYPTDTIWGLGCDACNEAAVAKIFDIKQRNLEKSMVILVADNKMLGDYVQYVHPKVQGLLDHHTRPLTVVYDKAKNLPTKTIAQDGSVAIRIVQDDFCQALIQAFGRPLISTSANISNQPYPKFFNEITEKIINQADYVVQHRQDDNTPSAPSVIVKLSPKGELIFLRK